MDGQKAARQEEKKQGNPYFLVFPIVGGTGIYGFCFVALIFYLAQGKNPYLLYIVLPIILISYGLGIYIIGKKIAIKQKFLLYLLNVAVTISVVWLILKIYN